MIRNSLLIIFLLSSTFAFTQNRIFELFTDSAALRKQNDLVIKDFEARVRKICDTVNFNGVKTVVKDSLYTGFYLLKTNSIYLTRWQTSPQLVIDFCTDVTGGKKEGDKLAAMFFYGFFLPHEAAHALQFNAHTRKDNEYDNEYEASEIAFLYWKARQKNKELDECYRIAKSALTKLKNPIPPNEDTKKYFTEHYDELAQDVYKYGYIMFKQIVAIFEDKQQRDFDSYIRQHLTRLPAKPSQR